MKAVIKQTKYCYDDEQIYDNYREQSGGIILNYEICTN